MAFQQLPLKKNKKKTGLYNQPLSNQLSSCFLGLVILLTANTVTADGVYVSCPTDGETSWVAVTGKQTTTFKVIAACHPTLVSKARWCTLSFLPFFSSMFSLSSPLHSAVSQCVSALACGPQYELAIEAFCLAKFRLDMQELDQGQWCSWEDTVE